MNGRKMRNRQIYFATHKTASAQLSATLSKDLRKKYHKRSARVVEGDTVKVIRGEFDGVDGKVTKISLANNGINIEGVKKDKIKGDKFDVYINTTNITITGLNSDDKWRMNKLEGKKPRTERITEPKTEVTKQEEETEKKPKDRMSKGEKLNEGSKTKKKEKN